MKEAVGTEPDIYDRKLRTKLLKKVAETNSLKIPNLYVWLNYNAK